MARQDSGKAVSRVGATGGGKTYRAQVPYRWYSLLALIVVLGIFLVVYSRYEHLHPGQTAASVAPTTSDHWVAGLDFDICGTNQQVLPQQSNAGTVGLYTTGSGVVQISPKSAAYSGTNATIGTFAAHYPKLTLTADSIGLPKKTVYKNGATCPSGTPEAGKKGELVAYIWPTATSTNSTTQTGDLRTVRFSQTTQLVTLAFVPSGTKVARPNGKIALAVLSAESAITTPTTTATSLPVTTTTTSSQTTTTTAASTTTTTSK